MNFREAAQIIEGGPEAIEAKINVLVAERDMFKKQAEAAQSEITALIMIRAEINKLIAGQK